MEGSAHKIVIVEDEGLIAADVKGRLERAGYDVPGIAASGGEALQLIRAESPDLVLMDVRLSGDLDGIQIAHKVHNELDIPVVFLTAYEDRETLQRASQTQAFGRLKWRYPNIARNGTCASKGTGSVRALRRFPMQSW
jgi:CheY-like chemotaxis protein